MDLKADLGVMFRYKYLNYHPIAMAFIFGVCLTCRRLPISCKGIMLVAMVPIKESPFRFWFPFCL